MECAADCRWRTRRRSSCASCSRPSSSGSPLSTASRSRTGTCCSPPPSLSRRPTPSQVPTLMRQIDPLRRHETRHAFTWRSLFDFLVIILIPLISSESSTEWHRVAIAHHMGAITAARPELAPVPEGSAVARRARVASDRAPRAACRGPRIRRALISICALVVLLFLVVFFQLQRPTHPERRAATE